MIYILKTLFTLQWSVTFLNKSIFYLFAEFQKLWRSIPVDSIDEEKIEEYLNKQGISSMQETGPKKVISVSYMFF